MLPLNIWKKEQNNLNHLASNNSALSNGSLNFLFSLKRIRLDKNCGKLTHKTPANASNTSSRIFIVRTTVGLRDYHFCEKFINWDPIYIGCRWHCCWQLRSQAKTNYKFFRSHCLTLGGWEGVQKIVCVLPLSSASLWINESQREKQKQENFHFIQRNIQFPFLMRQKNWKKSWNTYGLDSHIWHEPIVDAGNRRKSLYCPV